VEKDVARREWALDLASRDRPARVEPQTVASARGREALALRACVAVHFTTPFGILLRLRARLSWAAVGEASVTCCSA